MNALSKNIFVITNIGVCFTICYYYKEYIFYEKKNQDEEKYKFNLTNENVKLINKNNNLNKQIKTLIQQIKNSDNYITNKNIKKPYCKKCSDYSICKTCNRCDFCGKY
jgi:hypothetical protein